MKKLLLTAMVALAFSGSIFAQINSNLYESHWSDFNSGPYETLDALIAFFQINGEYITSDDEWESIEIAAYVDGECRGHSFLTEDEDLLHPYTELCIYHDDSSAYLSKVVSFRLYDHANEIEYVIPSTSILIGEDHTEIYLEDYDHAVILNFEENILTINLVQGWNYVSTYIDLNEVDGIAMLKEALAEHGTEIATFDDSAENLGDGLWLGLEDYQMTNADMIMVNVDADCSVTLQGKVVDPTTVEITLNPGWNWIGFPFDSEMSVEDALADFEPEEGDAIGDFWGLSDYVGVWVGDIETFVPGQGYFYYNASDDVKTLVYSSPAKSRRASHPFIK